MRKILLTLTSLIALAALTACGGGSSTTTIVPTPPSSGNNAGFTTASLSGTYVFSTAGASSASFAVVGSFVADGAGKITSGTRDSVNDAGGQALAESITGTYNVNQDGRGQIIFNGSSGQTVYRFVIGANGRARLFQISNTADAVGDIIPWPNPNLNISFAQVTYVFRFDGEDASKNPYGAVGALTLNSAGNTVTGTIDENDAGTYHAQVAVTGTIAATSTPGRYTASFTTATGTHNFVFYPVSQNHIEMLSTDKNFFLHAYADLQTGPISATPAAFSGDQVFSIAGYDTNGPILETGRLTLDGAGNLANAIEDYNDAGLYSDGVTFGGTYTVAANGRWTSAFTYTSSTMSVVGWQVTPQKSVVLVTGSTATNYNIVETGVMRSQTLGLTNASIKGNYAEDLSGYYNYSPAGNVESSGNFLAAGDGTLSGTVDSQTPTAINTDVAQTGSYSVAADGRGLGAVGPVPVHFYTVDADTIYLISTDANRLYQGKMVLQP